MKIIFTPSANPVLKTIREYPIKTLVLIVAIFSIVATAYSARFGYVIAYGDAESHLNISKRVIDSLTPGLAQLGGVWLPLPHILMVPFVLFDPLWRSGLAGAIVSGIAYIVAAVYLYKLALITTKKKAAGWVAALVFALNPNILYMQTTPMTELPLIAFFILSTYYFAKFLYDRSNYVVLILSALFAFAATLSRYDGWFLVMVELAILSYLYITQTKERKTLEGKSILFGTLAGFGILLWLIWDWLILGDPFYFKNSPFSANSQQQGWLSRGELPAFNNLPLSIGYYTVTSVANIGVIASLLAVLGMVIFLFDQKINDRLFILFLLAVPFIFYVVTLYIGQSIIFIPELTPSSFEWNLFNVRYGIMMVPFAAYFVGYLFSKNNALGKATVIIMIAFGLSTFISGKDKIITLEDGTRGLSASKHPDAGHWLSANYDSGLVLLDDYARTISVIRTTIPMDRVIYVGNRPYWEESLAEPEKHASWIIMQKNDTVWSRINENPDQQARLYKYFIKVYTSPDILIFRRMSDATLSAADLP